MGVGREHHHDRGRQAATGELARQAVIEAAGAAPTWFPRRGRRAASTVPSPEEELTTRMRGRSGEASKGRETVGDQSSRPVGDNHHADRRHAQPWRAVMRAVSTSRPNVADSEISFNYR